MHFERLSLFYQDYQDDSWHIENYICSKQIEGQTNAQPVNMSSLHLQCDPDNIEKRANIFMLKKTAPQKHILDNDGEPSSIYDAVQRLKKELENCCCNHCNYLLIQWNWLSRSIDCKTLKENEALVSADYSANLLSEAAKTDVCAILNHEVIGIFLVLHSLEFLTVKVADEQRNVRFDQCHAWHFLDQQQGKQKALILCFTTLALKTSCVNTSMWTTGWIGVAIDLVNT